MRQFGRRQIIPVQRDTDAFVIDNNGCVKIPFAKNHLPGMGWRVNMEGNIAENRYEAGYVDEYKTWLQDDLCGVVNPTPRVDREVKDVQMRL